MVGYTHPCCKSLLVYTSQNFWKLVHSSHAHKSWAKTKWALFEDNMYVWRLHVYSYRFCALGSRKETQDNGLREDSAVVSTESVVCEQPDRLTTLSLALSSDATCSAATTYILVVYPLRLFSTLWYIQQTEATIRCK